MARNVTVRKYKLGEEPLVDEEIRRMTSGERIELAWQLTLTEMMYPTAAVTTGVRRDVVRVIRPKR